jgi:hypothetical protein
MQKTDLEELSTIKDLLNVYCGYLPETSLELSEIQTRLSNLVIKLKKVNE